jgi:CheY-like chemotaxis protein
VYIGRGQFGSSCLEVSHFFGGSFRIISVGPTRKAETIKFQAAYVDCLSMKPNRQSEKSATETNSKRILIVEDDLTVQPLLEVMIQKISPGTQVEWSTSAEDAFDRLSSVQSSDESPYSVVLSDVNLSGSKSGFDLVDECFSNEVPANFIMSSGADTLDTHLPFLPKPYKFVDVKRELSPYLTPTLETPILPNIDLGIKKALRKAADWAIDQRESRLEWIALLAGAYACAYVFYGLIESLKHLPFQP